MLRWVKNKLSKMMQHHVKDVCPLLPNLLKVSPGKRSDGQCNLSSSNLKSIDSLVMYCLLLVSYHTQVHSIKNSEIFWSRNDGLLKWTKGPGSNYHFVIIFLRIYNFLNPIQTNSLHWRPGPCVFPHWCCNNWWLGIARTPNWWSFDSKRSHCNQSFSISTFNWSSNPG